MTDEERLENMARELCRAAGQDPDAKIRMGRPMSFTVGDCTIVKPLIAPAWKAYCREARRLTMADAEHAETSTDKRTCRRRRRMLRLRARARMSRIVLRRRLARVQLVARFSALCIARPGNASRLAAQIARRTQGFDTAQDAARLGATRPECHCFGGQIMVIEPLRPTCCRRGDP